MASPAGLPVVDALSQPSPCCDFNPIKDSNLKDASKRKRVNRNAKLKQCKLDARREQWLSQVTVKHDKAVQETQTEGSLAEEANKDDPGEVVNPAAPGELFSLDASERMGTNSPSHLRIKRPEDRDKEHSKHAQSGNLGFGFGDPSASTNKCMSDCCETDTSPKSCGDKSPKSKVTRLGKDFRGGRGRSEKKCSGTERKREEGKQDVNLESFGSSLGNASHGNGHDDSGHNLESEDDWEAAADALDFYLAQDKVASTGRSECTEEYDSLSRQLATACTPKVAPASSSSKPEYRNKACLRSGFSRSANGRAWRQDDVWRPASLPSLNKQQSLPARSGIRQQWSPVQKASRDPPPGPPQCPICTEDLDSTDSSFNPCSCGFRLCLFCHHRIASEDGRCPGCRKSYSTDMFVKPA